MAFDAAKFESVVIEALNIKPAQYRADLQLGDIEEWDSVAHLELISAMEAAFGVRFSADDMLELTDLGRLRERINQGA